MTLDQYAIVLGLGINFLTLVVLGWEIRLLRNTIRLQTTLAATDKILDMDKTLMDKPRLARVFRADKTLGKTSQKTAERAFIYSILNYFATLYILREKKYMDEDEWLPYDNYIRDVFRNYEFAQLWSEIRDAHWYYAPFERYIDSLIDKSVMHAEEKKTGGHAARTATGRRILKITEVLDTNSDVFRDAMRLYEDAFPSSEKETISNITRWLESRTRIGPNRYHILALILEQNGVSSTKGVAFFHYLADVRATFLGYLTIEEKSRHRGFGSVLFEAVKEWTERDCQAATGARPLGIFTELEKENPKDASTIERFRFWERHNVRPLRLDWRYPPLYPGNVPADMYLAICPLEKSQSTLSEAEAISVCTSIYRGVYGKGPDDPYLRKVIESIRNRGSVEAFSIASRT